MDFDEEFDVEENEAEEKLESFLKQYEAIKTTGTPCKVKEAAKWYSKVYMEQAKQYTMVCAQSVINFGQKLPFTKIKKEELEIILDDFDCMEEQVLVTKNILCLVWDLYHNPKNYNAWKGMLDKEEVYYVEAKPCPMNEEAEKMFI